MRDRRLLSAIKYQAAVILKAVTVSLTAAILSGSAFTVPVKAEATGNAGGGFAVTGQSGEAGYISVLYDATNGLQTSDANCVLGSSDGYIWIGGYSGVMKYDGNDFTRLPATEGLTNARGLFEDSRGRIWVGTNDNGVVVVDGATQTHFTYKDGLPSSSIRTFAEDGEGNVFVGTTEGICYVDPEMKVIPVDDKRINKERVLRLDSDSEGKIYGQTKNGQVFYIDNKLVTRVYSSYELKTGMITTIKADPLHPGKVYLGTEGDAVYYGNFGDPASRMERISVAPLNGIHWMSYDCNRLWVASIGKAGYLDENNSFHVLNDIVMDSGIEMMTSDYQGNMWFASSTQGVMKIVLDQFTNVYGKAGLVGEVTNAACMYGGELYIGTDNGLRIIDKAGHPLYNRLNNHIGPTRIRCMGRGTQDDLWIGTYTNNLGLIHLLKDGSFTSITSEEGLPDNEIRCICVGSDGKVYVGTNSGLAVIQDDTVINTFGPKEGIETTIILTAEEMEDGKIYVGTDGGGIYIINGDSIEELGRENGLTSDVILRIKKDDSRGLSWIITSNSIEYMKDGEIKPVSSFPNNNNYDLFIDVNNNAWVISSMGIYILKADDLISDSVSDFRLYTLDNGLSSLPTSLGYSELDEDGTLYIAGRNGVNRVNVNSFTEMRAPVKAYISSVYSGEDEIVPDGEGRYVIPSMGGRIRITASVLDYTLLNPQVKVYLDNKEDEGLTTARSKLKPLEYTGLDYGNHMLHLRVFDGSGKSELLSEEYRVVKKAQPFEHPLVRLLLFMFVALIAGFIVWRVLTSTVIRRQYTEIKRAKEDAERANAAKTRFLANMSHEIRTPINTIMGMNEMAMREDPTGVPKPYFMSLMNYSFDIKNAAESLLSLINDLLDMSKIESGKMHLVLQEYDTQEMLRSIVSMIRIKSTEKELTFDVTVDEILPSRLYGDQGKIRQIVINLLTNAVKYTGSGGFALSVSMDERTDDSCMIRFSVKDTGIGIKEEDMDKLFTAYERLDEQKNSGIQGTGLGLDISRRFAELMDGSLTCKSEYGKGSEFILTLPQKIIDKTPVGVFKERDEKESGGPYVPLFIAPDADVLVVDDNPMNLNVIKGLLKGTRVLVTTASSGEECLEKIEDTRFNIVLLDHMMPGMDGVETVERIRKNHPDLPVYALTANTAAGEEFYKSKGFDGYLSKPIDSRTLERTIMQHLPDEMMDKPVAEDVVEELTEIPGNLKWIYDTEGITVEEGIKNSGGISNYIFSLNLFLDTLDSNAKVIRDSYESGNIRLFTIKVHSLKSSARIIGAMELSKLAEALEDAGNKEDMSYIDANTNRLLAEYEAFREKLSGLHDNEDDSDKEMISEDELREAYRALADVIPQMDYDAVEMIIEQLNGYALPEDDAAKIKELSKMLKLFDWDGMEALITA